MQHCPESQSLTFYYLVVVVREVNFSLLKALKKKGIVPFETKTIEVGSLTDFTNVIIKEVKDAV